MNMKTWINIIVKAQRGLPLFLFLLIMSCQEWTPEAEGYYEVDGKRYNIHLMQINTYPISTNLELILQGAPAFYVQVFVWVPDKKLSAGDYNFSYGKSEPFINSMTINRGTNRALEIISYSSNSTGTMTVEVAGENYNLNFNGNIGGNNVKFYYSGLVASRNF
jgi:hypothetical protein